MAQRQRAIRDSSTHSSRALRSATDTLRAWACAAGLLAPEQPYSERSCGKELDEGSDGNGRGGVESDIESYDGSGSGVTDDRRDSRAIPLDPNDVIEVIGNEAID